MLLFGVDVGSSSTKTCWIDQWGREGMDEFINYVAKHDGYSRTENYVSEDSDFVDKLDLSIKIENTPDGQFKNQITKLTTMINNRRWLCGTLATSTPSPATQISGMVPKVSQEATYVNIISSLITTMKALGIHESTVQLGILLPPKELSVHDYDILLGLLSGRITVVNNLTGDKFVIDIARENIILKPESLTAFMSCFFDVHTTELTPVGEKFYQSYVMSVDVGDNTTDFSAMNEGRPLPGTYATIPNKATRLIMRYLIEEIGRKMNGYAPSMDQVKEAYKTGNLRHGNGFVWIGDEISAANGRFVDTIFNDFGLYLMERNIQLQQIAAFMFIGGGSTKVEGITSVPEHFMDMVKLQSRNVEYFSPADVRSANIVGLLFYLRFKKQAMEQ